MFSIFKMIMISTLFIYCTLPVFAQNSKTTLFTTIGIITSSQENSIGRTNSDGSRETSAQQSFTTFRLDTEPGREFAFGNSFTDVLKTLKKATASRNYVLVSYEIHDAILVVRKLKILDKKTAEAELKKLHPKVDSIYQPLPKDEKEFKKIIPSFNEYQRFLKNYPQSKFVDSARSICSSYQSSKYLAETFLSFEQLENLFHWNREKKLSFSTAYMEAEVNTEEAFSFGAWVFGNLECIGGLLLKPNGIVVSKGSIIYYK
ncbi:MAG: hypothetical protein LWX56_03575 [Ignavibacteria bacterium]|nr:hypothetical protein [Ignavibacteria bacterium]